MSVIRALRLIVLSSAVLAWTAMPAVAHPPEQHEAQLMPASALGLFNVEAQMRSALSAPCKDGQAGPYPCKNVDLASFVPLPGLGGASGNDIWGWTDPETGREYAIMGTSTSTAFVDVTDPQNPVNVGVLPTRGTPDLVLWRDIKVDGNYAFIVSEISRSGLQVFDLTRLRGRTTPTVFEADATYDGFSRAHNISINTESDYAYAVGVGDALLASRTGEAGKSNECSNGEESGGLHMIDISEPLNPEFAGCAVVPDAGDEGQSNNYAHDVECVNYDGPDVRYRDREICFGSNENAVVIYDVTDKSDPRVISTTTYDTATYTHQGALTADRQFFLFGDEIDEQEHGLNTTTYILDVRDLDKPGTPKAFTHATGSIDHNMYVHGQRVFQSNYMAGLRILEFDQRSLEKGEMEEVGFFDVVPGGDIADYAGTWSNFRFPSGTTVVSAIENEVSGLFVLRPRLPDADTAEQRPSGEKARGTGNGRPGGA